jgi:hypothetical protein
MARLRQRFAWIVTLALWACLSSSLLPRQVRAVDYDPLALECLVAAADAIVIGRADRDPSGSYYLEVTERVAGERLTGRVNFEISPWQGPVTRPLGTTALLFLRRPGGKQSLEVVGPSAEGWLPVQDGFVRLVGISMPGEQEQPGRPDPPHLELASLVNALRALDGCVKWSRDPARARVRATIVCDEGKLKTVRQQSAVAEYLVKAAVRASLGAGLRCLAVADGARHRQ